VSNTGSAAPGSALSAPQDREWRTSSLGRTGWPNRIRCRCSSWLSVRSKDRARITLLLWVATAKFESQFKRFKACILIGSLKLLGYLAAILQAYPDRQSHGRLELAAGPARAGFRLMRRFSRSRCSPRSRGHFASTHSLSAMGFVVEPPVGRPLMIDTVHIALTSQEWVRYSSRTYGPASGFLRESPGRATARIQNSVVTGSSDAMR